MRLAVRALLVLAVPGLVFGFLTRVSKPEFDAVDPGHAVHEPWLDTLTGLALAAAIIVAAAIVVGVLYLLGFRGDPRRPHVAAHDK
jgi:hypothetical protein